MSEWIEIKLGCALSVRHGFAFKSEFFNDEDGPYIVLTPGNFHDRGGFKEKSGKEKFYDGPVPDGFLLGKGNIVVAMTEQSYGLLGSTATIPKDDRYLHNQRIGLIQIEDKEVLNERFVYHMLNAPAIRNQIQATATGSKVRHTAPTRIGAVKARVPAVRTQVVIADVLDTIDDLIENNRRRIEVLEEMAQAIYREWFVHFRFPGHENATFVDSPLGPIPEGWEVGRLRDVATEARRSVKQSSETAAMAYVPIDSISPRSLTLRDSRPGEEAASSLRLFEEGEILFGAMRAYFHKVCIAPFPGVTRSTCFVLTPDPSRPAFAAHALSQVETIDFAAAHSTGSTIPYAKWDGVLSEMLIPLPPMDLSREFDEVADPLLGMARSLVPQTDSLRAIRDMLLPKLVSGEIDVSDLDLDAVLEGAV